MTALTMFLLGTVGGFFLAPVVFDWLASALNAELIATTIGGSFIARLRLSLGSGVLFAAAVIAPAWIAKVSRPLRWMFLYLFVGCVVSGGTAIYYREIYGATAGDSRIAGIPRVVSANGLPVSTIPGTGVFAVLSLGLLYRAIAGRQAKQEKRSSV